MKKTAISASLAIMFVLLAGTGFADAYTGHTVNTAVSIELDHGHFFFSNFGCGHYEPKRHWHRPPSHGFHKHGHHFLNGHGSRGHGHHEQPHHGKPSNGHGHKHGGRH